MILNRFNRRGRRNARRNDQPKVQAEPLHNLDLSPDPQSASPLYNGRIPPEIRDHIFAYALAEYTKSDPDSQYPRSTNYTRPGYTGKRTITFALLQTCKRTYLETYHLPPVTKEHVFWHQRWPADNTIANVFGDDQEVEYFKQLTTWQLKLVKEIHLFTQLFWLEGSFVGLSKQPLLQGIEKLKITIRRGDWWWNESNEPLGINPQRGDGSFAQMLQDWKSSSPIPWREDGWGCAFRNLKGLKELELELETSEDKVDELKAIVKHAKEWKFPLGEGMCLSADGLEPKSTEWRSTDIYWAETCPYCNNSSKCRGTSGFLDLSLNEKCGQKMQLKRQGLGPMCTIMSLRYKLAKVGGEHSRAESSVA